MRSLAAHSVGDWFASYSLKPFISIRIISVSHSLYIPETAPCEKNIYTYFGTIGLSNLRLTEFAIMHQICLNSLLINQCFQVLLDADSRHYSILSKVKAEILAAFAEYVWWRSVVPLATCNSCRDRLHWDKFCGENIVPCCCLESTPCRVSLPFSWLIGMSHRMSHPTYCHQGHEFHGVLHLADWGACTSPFFPSSSEKSA